MSLALADAEIEKLARLLGCKPRAIDFLRQVDWQDIRDLREQAASTMFEADRQGLQRVAAATKLMPSKITAAIGERAFGPLLAARVTGLLDPSRAVDIAGHLPTRFLADVGEQIDPRLASRVIAEIPAHQIAAVTAELAARDGHVTMGRYVGHLSESALKAALDAVDDEALLRTAYVIESKASIAALVAIVPEQRLHDIMRAANELDLWREALDVLRHVSDEQRGMLGDIAAEQDDDVLAGLVKAAQRDRLWADVLPVARAMGQDGRERFATLPAIQTRPVLSSIVDAAKERGLWAELLVLLPLLPAASRRRVAALGTGFGRSILVQIIAAAHEEELWSPLLSFAIELELRTQREAAKLLSAADENVLNGLLDAIEEDGTHEAFVRLIARLGATDMRAFAERLAPAAGEELLDALAEAAQEAELPALHKALIAP
jgi:hypothetical protein